MIALDLSPTGFHFDDSPDAAPSPRAPGGIALSQERFDSLRSSDHSPTVERFAPAWSELLHRAVAEPGLICDAYTRFHGYSLGNRFAALIQCEMRGLEPGPLNSFNGWRKLGYAIREGEWALTLRMPLKGALQREEANPEKVNSSGAEAVPTYKKRRPSCPERRSCSVLLFRLPYSFAVGTLISASCPNPKPPAGIFSLSP